MAKDQKPKRVPIAPEKLHSPERVLALSDGVVAIAITVLVLPLADIEIPENVWQGTNVTSYVWDTYSQLIASFIISWVVIIAYWFDHHRLFNKLKYVDDFTIRANMVWLFAIVIMPFPTNLLGQSPGGPTGQAVSLYLTVLFLTSASLCVIEYHANKTPELRNPNHPWYKNSWIYGLIAAVYILILAILAPLIGGSALWALFGLFFIGMFTRLVNVGEPEDAAPSETVDD